MGAPVASGTLAGSTSGSGPSIHREAARSDNTCSVDTLRSYDSHNSADHREVERRRRTRLPRKMKREDRRHQCGEIRPHPERARRGRAWLVRRANDGQVRLQVAADRSASKHGGGSCNGPPKRACRPVPPEDRTVDHADRLASGEYEVRRRRGPRHLHCCERSTRRKGAKSAAPNIPGQYRAWRCLPFRDAGAGV